MVKEKQPVIRVVLDTNVLVSALLFGGAMDRLIDGWKTGSVVPFMTRATFDEFRRVLAYPRFALTEHEISALIEDEVLPYVEIIEPCEEINGVCRDPEDDMFLSCAIAAQADVIVSGDKDLLEMKSYRGVPIMSVRDFLEKFN